MVQEDIDLLEAVLIDAVKVGAAAYSPLAIATPLLTSAIKHYGTYLRAGVAAGYIVGDGQGGFVTKAWAEDPRHQLNADGSFKE